MRALLRTASWLGAAALLVVHAAAFTVIGTRRLHLQVDICRRLAGPTDVQRPASCRTRTSGGSAGCTVLHSSVLDEQQHQQQPLQEGKSSQDQIQWLQQWLPLGFAEFMDKDKPGLVTILNTPLAVWFDPVKEQWGAVHDTCPHRFAALSGQRVFSPCLAYPCASILAYDCLTTTPTPCWQPQHRSHSSCHPPPLSVAATAAFVTAPRLRPRAPATAGRVNESGDIQCSYHGWSFGGSGACHNIPHAERASSPDYHQQQQRPRKLPPCATARGYPVMLRQGMVWVWMDPASPPPPQRSEPPEYEVLPGSYAVHRHVEVSGCTRWPCSGVQVVLYCQLQSPVMPYRQSIGDNTDE
jgi:nitrite reductase/ring-hydroxylating ferredoxin subunit